MANVMSLKAGRPETEVTEKATRRRYTAEYKARILREGDACTKPGELGALLRREPASTANAIASASIASFFRLCCPTPICRTRVVSSMRGSWPQLFNWS
jgi:hypothetical protein